MGATRILIVSDDHLTAADLERRLRRLGYGLAGTAVSGEQAVQFGEELLPDVVLLDIRLDSADTTDYLRLWLDLPVVYLAADADERAATAEACCCLTAPFADGELRAAIELALSDHTGERQLQKQTNQLWQMMAAVPDGVALLDPSLRLQLVNEPALAYLTALAGARVGDKLTVLGGQPIETFLLPSMPGPILTVEQPAHRVFEVRATPAQASAGGGWVLVIRDVTREAEIQTRVQQQERLAAVGQLAAGIAHDFNNIVASIIVGAHVVVRRETNLTPGSRDRLQTIAQQARRASDLIGQILDFSRATATEPQPFDLVPLLKEMSRLLERTLPENITLELHYDHNAAYTLNGDATRILQALMNLAVNARDAMPAGGRLRLDLARIGLSAGAAMPDAHPGGWLRITVADDGTGIPDDVLPHIFDPFFTTKGPGRGTGLGLSQVYSIVQQHHGTIKVSSAANAGTIFTLDLPALAEDRLIADVLPNEPNLLRGDNELVLLVEDDAAVRDTLLEALETLNYRVLAAANGVEALHVFERQRSQIQLVLTDLIMPHMGGVDLCRALLKQHPAIKIIGMTGYSPDGALTELTALGVTTCLQKPISFEALSRVVRETLRQPAFAYR